MGNIFTPSHLIIILLIILVLFGRGKISEFMGDFAKGIKSFKKGMKDEDEAENEDHNTPPQSASTMKTIEVQPEEVVAPVKRQAAPRKSSATKTTSSTRTAKTTRKSSPARKTTKSKS
ncbi:twin-arginine translocase TatA/TatE family subunit [Bartonella tamiae]|uniref:Sec-independent protein translocase protein TatA n=1 Tax=Bartonella tamiae Th239 TaxID=1094558 RepID=J0QXB9_9HYPH|nr:twin-arginine translocase TatA/TatE family subunit [Bartonella tamiae]EJF90696.1 TatA/E family twin arginine-targeting protein translocase [Bartonella tamiae Th239]EJF93927.1 TatA/E family twin arginine-targeting protein translocase [Bartonella tamiae Th307]